MFDIGSTPVSHELVPVVNFPAGPGEFGSADQDFSSIK